MNMTMTEQEYRARPELNASYLKNVLARSVAYADWAARSFKATPAMELGTAAHARILPNQGFFEKYALCELPRNTKAGKYLAASIEEEGKIALTKAQWDAVEGMNETVKRDPVMNACLNEGQSLTEHPFLFQHPKTGHGMKALLDHVNLAQNALIDLKTTSDISSYARDFWYRCVDLQLAQYRMACRENGIEIERVYVLAVESSAPYEAQLFEVPEDALRIGEIRLIEALLKYDEAVATNKRGLPTFSTIEVPAWLANQYQSTESPF